MPQAPRNTESLDGMHELLLLGLATGSGGEAIELQEKSGQSSFVNSTTLPSNMLGETCLGLESAGVVIGEPVPNDPLFVHVTLPEGWYREGTSHSMHSTLMDDNGRVRASIFYKPAFYDRDANIRAVSRFSVKQDYEADEGTVIYYVTDADETVFTGGPVTYTGEKYGDDYYEAIDSAKQACEEWLEKNGYPEWKNPGMYWD